MRPTIRWVFFGAFLLTLSFLTLKSPDVRAFTLAEVICKACEPGVSAGFPPATKAAVDECCKCHKPCSTVNGVESVDPAFTQCVNNGETCPTPGNCDHPPLVDECKTDADCAAKDTDGNPCTSPVCNKAAIDGKCPDGTGWGGIVGKCGGPETPIANCNPNKTCSDKYPGDGEAIKCCEYGFDTDPKKMKCCYSHLKKGEDPGTPAKPVPCGGNETCPTCPECKPPVIDCSVIADPTLKSCCQAKGGFLYFVMAACVHDAGDCNMVVNIGGDVNGQLNICCNVLNNTGTITDSTITQACSNTNGGGTSGATTGSGTGTPTTPASLGTCEVKCKDVDCKIAVDTAGQGVGWVVSYSPPPDVGPVASAVLKQLDGPALTAEDPASAGGALSIKTITDPSNLPPFIVYTPRPTSMMGEYLPKFKVAVQLNDLSDHELATLTCEQQTALEAKGGGSGCGCSMTAQMTTREQLVTYAVMMILFSVPYVFFRYLRKRAAVKSSH